MTPAGPLVVKLGGALLDDAAHHPGVFDALARLHQALPGGVVPSPGGAR